MTNGGNSLIPTGDEPQLPAFHGVSAWSQREVETLDKYRTVQRGGRTKAKTAGNREAPAVQTWAAIDALDDLFQRRYWITTQQFWQGDDVIVKVTFTAQLDGGGVIVREVYGGRNKGGDKAFIVGGSRLADALKAAEGDALKKLCGMLGMFQDVYRKVDRDEEVHHTRTLDSPRNQAKRGTAPTPAPLQAQLIAAAKPLGVSSWEELHQLLGTDSVNDLADHLTRPLTECSRDDCPYEHGVKDRPAAYKAIIAWVKEQPRKEE